MHNDGRPQGLQKLVLDALKQNKTKQTHTNSTSKSNEKL